MKSYKWVICKTVLTTPCNFQRHVLSSTYYILHTFRLVSPSYANVFRSFEVILNYGLQIKFEHTLFHAESLGGISLLLLAVIAISFEMKLRRRYAHVWYF